MSYRRYYYLNLVWLTLGVTAVIVAALGIVASCLFGFEFLRTGAVVLNTYSAANCLHLFRRNRAFVRVCKRFDRDLAELKSINRGMNELRFNCLVEQLEAALAILERMGRPLPAKPEPKISDG